MVKTISNSTDVIDCACVIHSTGYDWIYVERLYNMLKRNLSKEIRFHVYTELDRLVPDHMIKHTLDDWPGIAGPKRSWWHKLQVFNPEHHTGNLLYFDLDTVVLRDITWITELDAGYLWGIRDFKCLQNPRLAVLNSSILWWNVAEFSWVWDQFKSEDINALTKKHHGDQDYLYTVLGHNRIRYFNQAQIKSWRWQCLDGGYDFQVRKHRAPGQGTYIDGDTSVLVFHGHPKPHAITDPVIQDLWK